MVEDVSGEGVAFRPLVAFDFDGTLTWRDSFLAYLIWRYGRARYALGMARMGRAAVRYARDRDRERLKVELVREFLAGERREAIAADADRFATTQAHRLLRPDAIRCWRLWQKRHARLMVITASPEIIISPFARGLGAEMVMGTRLAFNENGVATGDLDGPNCRGEEKVGRLRAVFGDDVRLEAAYGDSDGDEAMLGIAEEKGMKVFGGRP